MSKLYTEEQLRQAYNEGCWNGFNEVKNGENEAIAKFTPIELSSEDEIYEHIEKSNSSL